MPKEERVLLIANRTAASSSLVEAVRTRAARGPARFYLVVPATPHGLDRAVNPEIAGREEAAAQLEAALPRLTEAAGSDVEGAVGDADPLAAITDAMYAQEFDEIILSTLPRRLSRWLRLDLPSKARHFGLPLTHVEAKTEAPAAADAS